MSILFILRKLKNEILQQNRIINVLLYILGFKNEK